ncbi:hypothetical protein H6775_03665 [Candidatus Nomurabacteria bacterium]|nr:hypothetical protein [Candidatus Nomurabacteria bacterium]
MKYLSTDFSMTCKEYLEHIKNHHPDFQIKSKQDNWFWKFLALFSPYLLKNSTTLFKTIWIPDLTIDFHDNDSNLALLSHEKVHLDQAYYGRFIGFFEKDLPRRRTSFEALFLFFLPYLIWPFPVKFAYFRVRAEVEAFARELKTDGSLVMSGENDFKEPWLDLSGPEYFWSCSSEKLKTIIEEQKKAMT